MSSIIDDAAAGVLPEWSCASPKRRAHIARVAELMAGWARLLAPEYAAHWTAAAWLHDALRDADPDTLRQLVDRDFREWPDGLLHGPAAAARIRSEEPAAPRNVLNAVAYHTVGHSCLDTLGRALYLADYLEPGRKFDPAGRAALRERVPHEFNAVLREVAGARIAHLTHAGSPLRPETAGFWQSIPED
jgi:2-amino-4-hydroxy-6-hydroxymethyldihydropteridine diphosphokinase